MEQSLALVVTVEMRPGWTYLSSVQEYISRHPFCFRQGCVVFWGSRSTVLVALCPCPLPPQTTQSLSLRTLESRSPEIGLIYVRKCLLCMYIIHLMIDGYEEEERMKTVVMMVKAFYICPDPRQGQHNREEPHHAESFPEKKKIYVVIVYLSGFCWYKIINNWW